MARPNPKNLDLSPAATDLGLSDAMRAQEATADEERLREKLAKSSGISPLPQTGLAATSLLGGMGGGV